MSDPQTQDDILNPHPWPPPYTLAVAAVASGTASGLALARRDYPAAIFAGIAFFSLAYDYMRSRGGRGGRPPGPGNPAGRPGGTAGGGGQGA